MTRAVELDLDDLIAAFDANLLESRFFMDLETGEVFTVSDEMCRERDRIYEETGDETGEDAAAFEEILGRRNKGLTSPGPQLGARVPVSGGACPGAARAAAPARGD